MWHFIRGWWRALVRAAPGAVALMASACARPATRTAAAPAAARYDVVIAGGRVVDGTGAGWFYGDVALRGDRIAAVAPAGTLARAATARRIDGSGLVVAPGFIDIQGQASGEILAGDGRLVSTVTQGITTQIFGEGWSQAPANARTIAAVARGGDTTEARIDSGFVGPHGFDRWLVAMERRGTSVNVGSFVGSASLRTYAVGLRSGEPSPAELDTMRAQIREAMRDGAFGLASALIYPPDNFSSTEQLVAVAGAMAPYGGVYITHMRSEADHFLEALDEAILIGRRGGVPVEIYHLKAAGRRNWGKARLAIAKIDSARAAGLDVGADMYPYEAGGTALAACIPPWASADGKLLDNLRDPTARARIRAELLRDDTAWENLCQLATPAGVVISDFTRPEDKAYEGKSLAAIAASRRAHWADALMDIVLAEEARLGAMFFIASEENITLQMRQPWIKFGTDASGVDPDSSKELVHPRTYGTFPRILGRYVREQRVMPLEEAIRKMTSAVATRLTINDRGVLRPGMYADVVVCDPATIADRATYDRPHQLSVGVRYVFVNGVEVVRDGRHTGAKPGRTVRGPGYHTTR